MLFVYLLRFIRGEVTFRLTGGFIERFLNLSARAGIPVFNTARRGETLYACTTARAYRLLRPVARRTGTRMRLTGKRGLPFLLRRYRKRAGLAAGAALFLLFLLVMSRYLWRIEVEGCQTLREEYILENLRACGVHERAALRRIDTLAAERQMLLITPEIGYIAINLRACTAYVQISEREPPPEMIDTSQPCNVVAARTGQIVEMEVYDGSPVVRVGDGVRQGELLVSGYMEGLQIKRGYAVHARAKVVAQFEQELLIEVPLREETTLPAGEAVERTSLRLFGLTIPLYAAGEPPAPYELATRTVRPAVLGLRLPVELTTRRYTPLRRVTFTRTKEEAREEARQRLWQAQQEFSALGEVLGKTAQGRLEGETYRLRAVFTLRQDIAQEKPFTVQEPPHDSPPDGAE